MSRETELLMKIAELESSLRESEAVKKDMEERFETVKRDLSLVEKVNRSQREELTDTQ